MTSIGSSRRFPLSPMVGGSSTTWPAHRVVRVSRSAAPRRGGPQAPRWYCPRPARSGAPTRRPSIKRLTSRSPPSRVRARTTASSQAPHSYHSMPHPRSSSPESARRHGSDSTSRPSQRPSTPSPAEIQRRASSSAARRGIPLATPTPWWHRFRAIPGRSRPHRRRSSEGPRAISSGARRTPHTTSIDQPSRSGAGRS
jgi:hypothetical protein